MDDLKYIWKGVGWIFDSLCVIYYVITGYLATMLSQIKLPEPSAMVKDYFFWALILLILARVFQIVMRTLREYSRKRTFRNNKGDKNDKDQ